MNPLIIKIDYSPLITLNSRIENCYLLSVKLDIKYLMANEIFKCTGLCL